MSHTDATTTRLKPNEPKAPHDEVIRVLMWLSRRTVSELGAIAKRNGYTMSLMVETALTYYLDHLARKATMAAFAIQPKSDPATLKALADHFEAKAAVEAAAQ